MSYSDFTLKDIKNKFDIVIKENDSLFQSSKPYEVSDFLSGLLKKWVPLAHAIGTEKARSEFIIAPVLAEVKSIHKVSLFSGISFNVDQKQGLNGTCDFIISLSEEQLALISPVITIVEAKSENITAGIPQCMAELIAAKLFNDREGNCVSPLFGCVTTGTVWKFLKYTDNHIYVDIDDYYIREIDKILGIFSNALLLNSQS